MSTANAYRCPNCGTDLSADALSCPKCKALFQGPDAWKPVQGKIVAASTEEPTLKVLRILGYISLVFWPAFIGGAGMAFDAPNAGTHVLPYVVVAFAVAYGVLPFVVPAVARAAMRRGRRRIAIAIAALPVSIVPFFTVVSFAMSFLYRALRN